MLKRKGIEHIHPPEEQIPFEFLPAEYNVYKENLKEWANELFINKKFPKKGQISDYENQKIKEIYENRKKEFEEGNSFLVPALNDIKREFGVVYLEYIEELSKLSNLSPSYILGVATFYTMLEGFDGKAEIYVCTSLPCALKGGEELIEKFKEKAEGKDVEVREWVCLGRCEFAPVVHIPYTEKSFGHVEEKDIDEIIDIAQKICPWKRNKK